MTDININIDDYISDQEKKYIAMSAFRSACERVSEENFERIIANAGYHLVEKEVDAAFDGKMRQKVREKSIEVINGLSTYSVFRPKDVWHNEQSKGWEALQSAIEDNQEAIRERVGKLVQEIDAEDIRQLLEDRLVGEIMSKLKGEQK